MRTLTFKKYDDNHFSLISSPKPVFDNERSNNASKDVVVKPSYAETLLLQKSFSFQQRRGQLDLRALSKIDLEKLIQEVDIDALQSVLENITFSQISSDDLNLYSEDSFIRLFRISQLTMEYLLHVQDLLANSLNSLAKKYSNKKREMEQMRQQIDSQVSEISQLKSRVEERQCNSSSRNIFQENSIIASEHIKHVKEIDGDNLSSVKKLHLYIVIWNVAKCINICVPPNSTLSELKRLIREHRNNRSFPGTGSISSHEEHLSYRGSVLKDDMSLISDLNISDGSILVLTCTESPSKKLNSEKINNNYNIFSRFPCEADKDYQQQDKYKESSLASTLFLRNQKELTQTKQLLQQEMDEKLLHLEQKLRTEFNSPIPHTFGGVDTGANKVIKKKNKIKIIRQANYSTPLKSSEKKPVGQNRDVEKDRSDSSNLEEKKPTSTVSPMPEAFLNEIQYKLKDIKEQKFTVTRSPKQHELKLFENNDSVAINGLSQEVPFNSPPVLTPRRTSITNTIDVSLKTLPSRNDKRMCNESNIKNEALSNPPAQKVCKYTDKKPHACPIDEVEVPMPPLPPQQQFSFTDTEQMSVLTSPCHEEWNNDKNASQAKVIAEEVNESSLDQEKDEEKKNGHISVEAENETVGTEEGDCETNHASRKSNYSTGQVKSSASDENSVEYNDYDEQSSRKSYDSKNDKFSLDFSEKDGEEGTLSEESGSDSDSDSECTTDSGSSNESDESAASENVKNNQPDNLCDKDDDNHCDSRSALEETENNNFNQVNEEVSFSSELYEISSVESIQEDTDRKKTKKKRKCRLAGKQKRKSFNFWVKKVIHKNREKRSRRSSDLSQPLI